MSETPKVEKFEDLEQASQKCFRDLVDQVNNLAREKNGKIEIHELVSITQVKVESNLISLLIQNNIIPKDQQELDNFHRQCLIHSPTYFILEVFCKSVTELGAIYKLFSEDSEDDWSFDNLKEIEEIAYNDSLQLQLEIEGELGTLPDSRSEQAQNHLVEMSERLSQSLLQNCRDFFEKDSNRKFSEYLRRNIHLEIRHNKGEFLINFLWHLMKINEGGKHKLPTKEVTFEVGMVKFMLYIDKILVIPEDNSSGEA